MEAFRLEDLGGVALGARDAEVAWKGLAWSQGGQASWENIVCSCLKCNVRKGGRTPSEARMRLIREPVQPKTSPALSLKLNHRRYQSWKSFLDNAYWSVELR